MSGPPQMKEPAEVNDRPPVLACISAFLLAMGQALTYHRLI
jgi:hypothetical protein